MSSYNSSAKPMSATNRNTQTVFQTLGLKNATSMSSVAETPELNQTLPIVQSKSLVNNLMINTNLQEVQDSANHMKLIDGPQ